MKKWIKIVLISFFALLAIGAIVMYKMYNFYMGNEDITGPQGSIPEEAAALPKVEEGIADWLNWRGSSQDGISSFTGIKKDFSTGPVKQWQVDYLCQGDGTGSWSAPVVKGKHLIIPGRDETSDILFCLDSETGKLIWKSSYPCTGENNHGPGPRATPYIDGDYVYSFGRYGDLICWKLFNGEKVWHVKLGEMGIPEPNFGHSSSPLVVEDKVIIQAGGDSLIMAFNKNNGAVAWTSMSGEAAYAATTTIEIDSTLYLLVFQGMGLSCINPANGNELWTYPYETKFGNNATTPAVSGDIVYISADYDMGGTALKVSSQGYEVLWKSDVMWTSHSDPIILDGYMYGYSGTSGRNKGQFKCVELLTGKEMWSTEEIGQGTTAYADNILFAYDLDGNLFLIEPTTKAFTKLYEILPAVEHVSARSWTVPVIANGKIYLRYMQYLVCYDLVN